MSEQRNCALCGTFLIGWFALGSGRLLCVACAGEVLTAVGIDELPLERLQPKESEPTGLKLKHPLTCTLCGKKATTDSEANGGLYWTRLTGWTYSRRAGYRCPQHRAKDVSDTLQWVMGP